MSALTAGLCLLPVGVLIVVLSPLTGRLVGARGPRLPLVVAGAALALGGARVALARPGHAAAGRARDLPAVRRLPGHRQPADHQHGGLRHAPLDGRGGRLAGLRRPADRHHPGRRDRRHDRGIGLARGGTAFTGAEHGVWWLVFGLGAGILVLGLLSTGRWARETAARAAALFDGLDRGAARRVPAQPS